MKCQLLFAPCKSACTSTTRGQQEVEWSGAEKKTLRSIYKHESLCLFESISENVTCSTRSLLFLAKRNSSDDPTCTHRSVDIASLPRTKKPVLTKQSISQKESILNWNLSVNLEGTICVAGSGNCSGRSGDAETSRKDFHCTQRVSVSSE